VGQRAEDASSNCHDVGARAAPAMNAARSTGVSPNSGRPRISAAKYRIVGLERDARIGYVAAAARQLGVVGVTGPRAPRSGRQRARRNA
jgi:hypothetical protein